MARLACWVTAGVLLAFAIAGKWIFQVPRHHHARFPDRGEHRAAAGGAGHVAGATLARPGNARRKRAPARRKTDIAITPLAIPMLAGPGAISTAILLQSRRPGPGPTCRALRCASWAWPRELPDPPHFARGARWLSPIAMKITSAHHGPAAGSAGDPVHAQRVRSTE